MVIVEKIWQDKIMRQQKVSILPGETLWESLRNKNIMMTRPCGGKGTCGRCQVEIKGIGRVKSCLFREPGTYEVILPQEEEFSVVEDMPAEGTSFVKSTSSEEEPLADAGTNNVEQSCPYNVLVIGVDLGTTTVALKAMTDQRTLIRSFVNPQRTYGADVMSRIDASVNGLGTAIQEQIKTELNKNIDELIVESGLEKGAEVSVVISGNTTMLHLLRGLSCEGLGKAPFLPVELGLCQENWNISGVSCQVTFLPGISALVVGDIVRGNYGLDLMEKNETSLLLDLGTNGEMALIKSGKLLVTSAAAGPAFEGTWLAMKLHGAGIINLLYFMRKENIIDEYGTLCDEYFEEGYPVSEFLIKSDMEIQITKEERASLGVITQDDIRAIQMAKGAIRAGIEILLNEAEISSEQVDHMYLAGGMGFYLDAEKAVGIGLLPEGFGGRIEIVGNSSLQGALKYGKVMTVQDVNVQQKTNSFLEKITGNSREIVLANHPDFEEKYIENMNFWEN